MLVSYDSFKNSGSSLGLQFSAEYFDYPSSYDFIDLKLSGTFKFRLIPLNNSDTMAKLFVTLGAGADFVFRDDGDYGAYIHLAGGLEFVLYGDDRNDVVFRTDVAGTFQKGSTVLHASVGLGVRLGFGKSFDEKPAAEPAKEEPLEQEPVQGTPEERPSVHVHVYNILPELILINRGENGLEVKWYHICSECGELIEGSNPFYDALYGDQAKGGTR